MEGSHVAIRLNMHRTTQPSRATPCLQSHAHGPPTGELAIACAPHTMQHQLRSEDRPQEAQVEQEACAVTYETKDLELPVQLGCYDGSM